MSERGKQILIPEPAHKLAKLMAAKRGITISQVIHEALVAADDAELVAIAGASLEYPSRKTQQAP